MYTIQQFITELQSKFISSYNTNGLKHIIIQEAEKLLKKNHIQYNDIRWNNSELWIIMNRKKPNNIIRIQAGIYNKYRTPKFVSKYVYTGGSYQLQYLQNLTPKIQFQHND